MTFSDGLAFVETEERTYYVDQNGNPQITSPVDGFKICNGRPFDRGLAMVGPVKENEDCARVIQIGSFRKAANSAYAYINKSGEIIHRQSLEEGRYLKRRQDSIRAAERRAEQRRPKAEAQQERKQLAKCADFKSFGDTTATSYLEIGYRGVERRFYYANDVFEKKSDTFRYHIPPLQRESGHTFLTIQPITLEPSFMNPDELEAQSLGYRFSLSGGALQKNDNECINFPTEATSDGPVMNMKMKEQSSLWERGQIKYADSDNSETYILIDAQPDEYKNPSDESGQTSSIGGFITEDGGDRSSIDDDDKLTFRYSPEDEKLEISARVGEEAAGGGMRSYGAGSTIQNFDGSPGKYVNSVVDQFDDHYVRYYHVLAYSDGDVHVKEYMKDFTEKGEAPPDGDLTTEALSFPDEYLVGEYKGTRIITAVEPDPAVYELSEN